MITHNGKIMTAAIDIPDRWTFATHGDVAQACENFWKKRGKHSSPDKIKFGRLLHPKAKAAN